MIIKRRGLPALPKTTPDNNNALHALFLRKVVGQVNRLLCQLSGSDVFKEAVANSRRETSRERQALKSQRLYQADKTASLIARPA